MMHFINNLFAIGSLSVNRSYIHTDIMTYLFRSLLSEKNTNCVKKTIGYFIQSH